MSKKVTLEELRKENEKILARALRVQALIAEEESAGTDFKQELYKSKNAELYYKITAPLSAQKKAPLGEKFLCHRLGYKKIASSKNRGDAKDSNGFYYEFKNSFTNEDQCLNIRQIRLWQEVDFYYCFYINEEELNKSIFFVLTKEEMTEEVSLYGSYTHGTTKVNTKNSLNEYSITIPIYDDSNPITKRWKEKYLSLDLKNKILEGVINVT